MKLYINCLNLDRLPIIMNSLKEYYISSKTYVNIYSVDGLYEINNSTTNKLIPLDNNIIIMNNYYKDFCIIADPSYFNMEPTNQINPNNISTKMKKCFFQINKKSVIKLIIEGEIIDNNSSDLNINPYDIYFELPNDTNIHDPLVKEEIIVFLSLLN